MNGLVLVSIGVDGSICFGSVGFGLVLLKFYNMYEEKWTI